MTAESDIREIYHFNDFKLSNYHNLLLIAKSNFIFQNFINFVHHERFVIWRHDIDLSPQRALRMAGIEAQESIYSTYFLHLHNICYNALEPEIVKIVKEIIRLGHHLGLHFDTEFYGNLDRYSFEHWLRFEAGILESVFGVPIKVFSFHNTTPFTLECSESEYAGLINATSAYFREQVMYCSDSNGYWRFRRLEDVLRDPQVGRLQILTHPEWWQDEVMSPRHRILRCIDGRAKRTIELYDKTLQEFGRENVDL